MTDTLHSLAQRVLVKASQLAQTAGDVDRRAHAQLDCLDGWPASSWPDGQPRGGNTLTSVESAAARRLTVTAGHGNTEVWGGYEQLHDDMIATLSLLDSMLTLRNRILATTRQVAPEPVKAGDTDLCCGGATRRWEQFGGMVWGDPTCRQVTHAFDLCATHLMRARAHCRDHGIEWHDPTPTQRAR